ncbi:MAG: DNA-binding transcriptional regulator Fis [Gammaproteobacteria bacterium]|nr:DNA-binding transcriptional regulator Fis [Gammaproteobacteria bacterium]
MSDAASVVDNITQILVEKTESKTSLHDSVINALDDYFDHLDGHPGGNLYQMVLQEIEQPLLTKVMQHVNGNQSKASVLLGLNRGTLRKKLKLNGLHN